MMNLRQILGLSLLVLTLSGCSIPDAGLWRDITYTKIADSQADAGDMRGARESAALALESAWNLGNVDQHEWARAAALAEGGDLAAGRGFADRALALLPDIEPGHAGVSAWVLYALARTAGTERALSKAAEVFDQASEVTASGWTAIALAQGQVGDPYGMTESLARAREDLEIVITDKTPEKAADDLTDATADWA